MIMFKLLLIPVFILIVLGIVKFGKFLLKVVDSWEIDEQKNDINHKADLVDEVEGYTLASADKITKASSGVVESFKKM